MCRRWLHVLGLVSFLGVWPPLAGATGPAWVEVRSPHFSVLTDAGEKSGREVALRFEQMRVLFGKFLGQANVTLPAPLQVVAFRSSKEMNEFTPLWQGKPTQAAGWYFAYADVSFILLDLSVPDPWPVVFHEYAHELLNGNTSSRVQLWFDEGFAEYFSTIKISDKEADIGLIAENQLNLLRQNTCRMTGGCNNVWMSTRDLFQVPRESSVYHETTEHRSMFYAESWLAVHYIYDKRWIDRTFSYFNLVSSGVPVEDAIRQAFGITSMVFDGELHGYVKEGRFLYAKVTPPVGIESSGYSTKTLDGSDATAMLADVHLHAHGYEDKAVAEFENVLKVQPGNSLALRGLGDAFLKKGDFQRASDYLKQALEHNPDDPRALYYSGLTLEMEEGANLGKDLDKLAVARKQLERATALDPEYADAFARLGQIYAAQAKSDSAIHMMLEAAELSPRNEGYSLDLAQLYIAANRYDDAIPLLQLRARSGETKMAAAASAMLKTAEDRKRAASQGHVSPQGAAQSTSGSPSGQKPNP